MDINSLANMSPSKRQELMKKLAEIEAKEKADAALEVEKKKKEALEAEKKNKKATLEAENGGKLKDLMAKRDELISEINDLEPRATQLKAELAKEDRDLENELKNELKAINDRINIRKEAVNRRRNTELKDLLSDIRHKKTDLGTVQKDIADIQKVQSTPPPHAQQVMATARAPIRQYLIVPKTEQNGDGSSSSTSKRSPTPATTDGGSIGSSLDENDPPGEGFDLTMPIPPICGLGTDPSGIARCLRCFMAVNLAKMSNYTRHRKSCEAKPDLEIMGEREKNRGLTAGRKGKRPKAKPANEFEDVQPSKKIKSETEGDNEDADGRSILDGGIEDATNGGIELQGGVIITNGMDGAVGLIPIAIVNNNNDDNSTNAEETTPKNVEAIETNPNDETSPKKEETVEVNPNPKKLEENETCPSPKKSSFFFGSPQNFDQSISEVTHPKYAPPLLETEDPMMAAAGTSEVKEEKELSSLIERALALAKAQGKKMKMVFDE